jgi:hypothetical protein
MRTRQSTKWSWAAAGIGVIVMGAAYLTHRLGVAYDSLP